MLGIYLDSCKFLRNSSSDLMLRLKTDQEHTLIGLYIVIPAAIYTARVVGTKIFQEQAVNVLYPVKYRRTYIRSIQ